MAVTVDLVPPELTYPLRWRVLHPFLWPHEEGSALDRLPTSATWAATDARTGNVVGSVLVHRLPLPFDPLRAPAWRLRAMATAPERRGEGIADLLIGALVDHVEALGTATVWCSARAPVVGLYRRWGFAVAGQPWVEPRIGPHHLMFRPPWATDVRPQPGKGPALA